MPFFAFALLSLLVSDMKIAKEHEAEDNSLFHILIRSDASALAKHA